MNSLTAGSAALQERWGTGYGVRETNAPPPQSATAASPKPTNPITPHRHSISGVAGTSGIGSGSGSGSAVSAPAPIKAHATATGGGGTASAVNTPIAAARNPPSTPPSVQSPIAVMAQSATPKRGVTTNTVANTTATATATAAGTAPSAAASTGGDNEKSPIDYSAYQDSLLDDWANAGNIPVCLKSIGLNHRLSSDGLVLVGCLFVCLLDCRVRNWLCELTMCVTWRQGISCLCAERYG